MALKLKTEHDLRKVGLIDFFEAARGRWQAFARSTYAHVRQSFPEEAKVRPDDVADLLIPLLRVNSELEDFLSREKLTQKYWVAHFVDLILDRCWAEIIK